MSNSNTFKENIAPALVLVCICLVVTLALAGTYKVANPVIQQNAKKTADETRAAVLPKADSFAAKSDGLGEGVTEYYVANNKSGVVVTTKNKSFGGDITVMTGIDASGKITGVQVTEHADTPGLGTKAMTPEYLAGYKGIAALDQTNIKDDTNVDYIVGASISSNGIYGAVQKALKQFKESGGVN